MRVSLFDYGTGNLHSLGKALEAGGATVGVESNPARILDADALVLPGVGAFGPAAAGLAAARRSLVEAIEGGFPCLGICLGLQLLFEASDESPGRGLGVIAGRVRRLNAEPLPQMGWNSVDVVNGDPDGRPCDPLFAGLRRPLAYYANSYVAEPETKDSVIAYTNYGTDRFAAALRYKRTWGVQFHPEKSADDGLRMIRNFLDEVRDTGDRA